MFGVASCVVIGWIVFGKSGDRPPTNADRRALADEVCPRVTTPHFYRIEKAGKTSYLLGTRHAGVSLAKYPPIVAQEFRDATVAVFESSGGTPPPPEAQSVEDALGPKLWVRYRELVGDEAATRVDHASITSATATLALLYEDTRQAIDVELHELAQSSNKRIVALEDEATTGHLREQYLGVDSLRTAIKQIPRRVLLETEVRKGLRRYCSEGHDPVSEASSGDQDSVTRNRTRAWVPKLVPLLENGGVFIAVGSGHVDEGSLSIVTLLETEGFEVHAVRP